MQAVLPPKLIVGLGNDDIRYEKTRHNAGFWMMDALAQRWGVAFKKQANVRGSVCQHGGMILFKPNALMNINGGPIVACMRYYKVETSQLLVVHDELDLPVGRVKFKLGGGTGGHNGLKDLQRHCGSLDFMRIRLGIGRPPQGYEVSPYVLGTPSIDDKQAISDTIQHVLSVLPDLCSGDQASFQKNCAEWPRQ